MTNEYIILVYADLVRKGRKKIENVPEEIREKVIEVLNR